MLEENQKTYSTIMNATRPTRSSTPILRRQISRSFSRIRVNAFKLLAFPSTTFLA